jgi:glyoxylase-like metal-dependent hydrolase (beta-lactamase superfamily II)
MQLGEWQLEIVSGGTFWIDGGVMFGLVPRALWTNVSAPDESNRILCADHCILARNGRQTVLVDTGYGGKYGLLDRKFYGMESGEPLVENLAARGLSPEDIDLVVFSHLHFDHVGGASRRDLHGRIVPAFPKAKYFVGRMEWEDAASGMLELQTAYSPEHLAPLEACGRLVLMDDGSEVVPGLRACLTGGHTRGHLSLRFESGGQTLVYLGDLCPTTNHLRRMWHTAYDTYPLDTRRRKPHLLGEAADRGWWIVWNHDPKVAVSRLQRHPKREFVVVEPQAKL